MVTRRVIAPLIVAVALSCTHASPTPAPTPAPAPAAGGAGQGAGRGQGVGGGVAAGGAVGGAVGAGRGGAPGGGRVPLTPEQIQHRRDSIATVRGEAVTAVLASIAGHENEPAGQVFKNVQLLKDMPARQFVVWMDSTAGRSLSSNCTNCHVAGDYSDDSRGGKKTTRIMINMMNAINNEQLSKLPAGRNGQTPKINCITCHRGIGGTPGLRIMPPG